MPLETFTGPSVPRLLARAQAELGVDAVVVKVDRSRLDGGSTWFQLTAADSVTAAHMDSTGQPARLSTIGSERVTPSRIDASVIVLVGPTGSGKTTAIAKLAAHKDAFGGRKVGLLCLDVYKVGAADQLRLLAETMRMPLAVAYQPSDMKKALRRLRRRDVILVDTPGRGPHNEDQARAVHSMLRLLPPAEVHLAIPAGLSRQSVKRIIATYKPVGVTHGLVTKLDEFDDSSTVLDMLGDAALPVRWMSCGQRIRQDLRLASRGPSTTQRQSVSQVDSGAPAA